MTFGVLALIVLAGLAGPLLGAGRRAFVPVVIGEILAGVMVGRTALDAVDPTDPAVRFLGDVGFAMLMFTVGAHIPLRDAPPQPYPGLRKFVLERAERDYAVVKGRPPNGAGLPGAAWDEDEDEDART